MNVWCRWWRREMRVRNQWTQGCVLHFLGLEAKATQSKVSFFLPFFLPFSGDLTDWWLWAFCAPPVGVGLSFCLVYLEHAARIKALAGIAELPRLKLNHLWICLPKRFAQRWKFTDCEYFQRVASTKAGNLNQSALFEAKGPYLLYCMEFSIAISWPEWKKNKVWLFKEYINI